MRQQIAVFGLGRFGTAFAEEMTAAGHDVLGVDADFSVVQRMSDRLTQVVQADAGDEDTLKQLGLADFDAAIIGISEQLETSILATMLLKRLGVPRVVAKARNALHGDILERVGADRVVFPERDTGMRLAHAWSSLAITDTLDVVEGYTVARVSVPSELVGKSIDEALGGGRLGVSLLLHARGRRVAVYPSSQEVLAAGDVLMLAGQLGDLDRFFAQLGR